MRGRRKKSFEEKREIADQAEESEKENENEKETKGSDWRKNEIENKAIIKNRKKRYSRNGTLIPLNSEDFLDDDDDEGNKFG